MSEKIVSKTMSRLQSQLQMEEYKKYAEDCIKIYNKLSEISNGSVWSRDWDVLVTVKFLGKFPSPDRIYKPTKVGQIFLEGIKTKSNNMSKYYIARDNDNSLWVYTKIPFRYDFSWDSEDGAYEIDETLFPEVKKEDKEPKVLTIADNTCTKVEDKLPNNDEKDSCII